MKPEEIRRELDRIHADPAAAGMSAREIARATGIGRATVGRYRRRYGSGGPLGRPERVDLLGPEAFKLRVGDAAKLLKELPDRSVDLVFTSPPYEDARTYGIGFRLRGPDWVDWLAPIVAECCRVSNGLAVVNVAGVVRDHVYSGAVELLVARLILDHGIVCAASPYAWLKNGSPGSGGKHYHRRDWEPIYTFALPDRLPLAWSNPTAFGQPPKRPRERVHRKRDTNGRIRRKKYKSPSLANPGNVVRVNVGGGHMAADRDRDGEAIMPEAVAERFVAWFCPPAGIVLDPFVGTGTTLLAARTLGRRGIGFDVRPDMVEHARSVLAKS